MKLPITLSIFAKDNEDSISIPILSAKEWVKEIIVLDTGSQDQTTRIAAALGARIYSVGFTNFGCIRTVAAHLASQPWVLGLDSDEALCASEVHRLEGLIVHSDAYAWGLPRRRWADLAHQQQVEQEVYPDLQYRLIRNMPDKLWYVNHVHERLVCNIAVPNCVRQATDGPHIEHYQDVFKSGDRLKRRNALYRRLYECDIAHGITHSIPAVVSIDEIDR